MRDVTFFNLDVTFIDEIAGEINSRNLVTEIEISLCDPPFTFIGLTSL